MKFYIYSEDKNTFDYYKGSQVAYSGDAGLDLIINEDIVFAPNKTILVDLQVKVCLKEGETRKSFLLVPRSSIYKTPLRMSNSPGIIDKGYNGNLKIPLDNTSSEEYILKKDTRLCQICCPSLDTFDIQVVNSLEDFGKTERGEGGFGSSG